MEPMNIGIHCGESGLLVLDEDKAGELARYAADLHRRHGQGKALLLPGAGGSTLGNKRGDFGDCSIDVRAGNGYVVGPGSTHQSGVIYRIESDVDPVQVPNV